MPSTVLDAPSVVPAVPRRPVHEQVPPSTAGRAQRVPVPVVVAAVLAVLQALGLLALGLTSLDGIFGTGVRPSGLLVAVTLLLLAGWVVLCAGGGASLVDGAGRHLMVAVACGEIALLVALALAGALGAGGVWLVALGPLGGLPVPALALLTLGLPSAKLLLATSPSAVGWVQAGGRPSPRRTTPVVEHRRLRTITIAGIGLALTGLALLGSPTGTTATPGIAAVVDAP